MKEVKKPAKKNVKKLSKKVVKKVVKKTAPKEELIGKITHYYDHIEVGIVEITKNPMEVGEKIHVKGSTTDFEQKIDSMQIEHEQVNKAKKGDVIGLRVVKALPNSSYALLFWLSTMVTSERRASAGESACVLPEKKSKNRKHQLIPRQYPGMIEKTGTDLEAIRLVVLKRYIN